MHLHSLALAAALLGCTPDADTKLDTSPPDSPPPDSDPPASDSLRTAFTLDATGMGSDRLAAVEVQGNVVELELSGVSHRGVAYQHHDWQSTGYVLFDLLTVAVDGSNLAVTYLYGQDGALPYVYTESFEHPMDWENSSGAVTWLDASTVVTPGIPELLARPQPTDVGITITGDELWLSGTSGGILLEDRSYELLPFATVDCTDCPGGPWLELHCLFVDEDRSCFGIVYLFPDEPGLAQLSYGLCLPDLQTPSDEFGVAWSGTLAAVRAARPAGPQVGRPPPAR